MAVLARIPAQNRVHLPPHLWQSTIGTDYWFLAGNADLISASSATNVSGLDSYGWTTTSLGVLNTVTADFMSAADDTPIIARGDGANDALSSPAIFGDYAHAFAVSKILGYFPTTLNIEVYAAFTTASANESTTNIGFHNGSAIVASIYSDGTNFQLSNGSTTDAGIVVDNAYHLWKITIPSSGNMEWFIDGTSQGTLAKAADAWPVAFLAFAATTNRFGVSWVHIWYA